jgi:hypothetical protein
MVCKKSLQSMKQRYFEGKIHNSLSQVPPNLLLHISAGRIARELSPVDIIPPWFTMLIYHWGEEQ